jgi:phage-related protein
VTARAAKWCRRFLGDQEIPYSRRGLDRVYKNIYILVAKDIAWVGRSLAELRGFPAASRREAGHQLHLVQLGLEPDDWRPMPTVGPAVVEIRLHGDREHRVFYIAGFPEAVYVLHAFEKRTQKTSQRDIDMGRQNLKELRNWRREQGL